MLPEIAGVLLAAGAGRRSGGPKALRRDADGTSWLNRSVGVLLDGGCAEVVVVLGCERAAAAALLTGWSPDVVRAVGAVDWETGMAASLRVGLRVVVAQPDRAALVQLVDLPDVSAAVVQRVLGAGLPGDAGGSVLARAVYRGRPGHPVLFGAAHLPQVIEALGERDAESADVGARDYLTRHGVLGVECGDLASGQDRDQAE